MIELRDVCAGYHTGEVLHHVNLTLEPGKVTVLTGPNGCGKSTLLKTLIRLNPHTSGDILVDGTPVEQFGASELSQKVAYLPQNKRTPDITVLRMVLHGRFAYLKYPRRYREEDFRIAWEALERLGIAHLANEELSRLSGGTQQKVYIAMALAQNTQTILLDEPTAYLDISYQLKTMEIAKELAKEGKSVVMVLHDLAQAFQTADSIAVMSEGMITACGTPEEVYQSGTVDRIFGIRFERMRRNQSWHYFYE